MVVNLYMNKISLHVIMLPFFVCLSTELCELRFDFPAHSVSLSKDTLEDISSKLG